MKIATLLMGVLALILSSQSLSSDSNKLKLKKNSSLERYIVVLKDENFNNLSFPEKKNYSEIIAKKYQVDVIKTYKSIINGFIVEGSLKNIQKLSNDKNVEYIEQDSLTSSNSSIQENPPWGLDRIDQRNKSLDSKYHYDRTGKGVDVYIVDSGIYNLQFEFIGRLGNGFSAITDDGRGSGNDCHGHGSKVAGIIGSETYGVAKEATMISIQVAGCDGSGRITDVAEGLDWIITNGQAPAIVNISRGTDEPSPAYDIAVNRLIDNGFVVVVAAGNDAKDACFQSPARVPRAITVGSVDNNDKRAYTSNYGQCVDVWAPGVGIDTTTNTMFGSTTASGTSFAAPHVSGIAALFLENRPNATVNQVIDHIMGKVTYGKVTDRKTSDTPNLLAYSLGTNNNYSIMHRYWNQKAGDHFYTMNFSELQSAPQANWKYESALGYVQRRNFNNSFPLYRYYHASSTDHFYTTNYDELGSGHSGWKLKGIAGYLPPSSSQTKSIYRYYNRKIGDHMYTTNWNELGGGNSSWIYEGLEGQVFSSPQD